MTPKPIAKNDIETPSGKDADYENFPVGSFLLPAEARPHVAVFYRYARAIDDIADNPETSASEKISRLDGFAAALNGEPVDQDAFATGLRMRESLLASHVPLQHCLDLIDAFKQDAVKSRYDDWDDLMHYCIRSAAPVGRYLIDLTGGSKAGYASSDALCNALQVINHLQDCKEDYETMDRVYLPMDWMNAAGASVEDLSGTQASEGIRSVIDQCIDASHDLMTKANRLPADVISRRLSMESAAIVNIANALLKTLSVEDPVAKRVKLNKMQYARCVARGAVSGIFA